MRRILIVPVVAVALATLSACGSDSDDDANGSSEQTTQTPSAPSPSASATPTWSATEPPVEPQRQQNTDAGADEYGQFVLNTAFYGYATGDAKPIVQRGDKAACTGCAQLQKFQDAAVRKYQIPSEQPTFEMTDVTRDGQYTNLEYSMDVPAGKRVDEGENNAETTIAASEDVPARVNLRWDNDHWVLMNFALGN